MLAQRACGATGPRSAQRQFFRPSPVASCPKPASQRPVRHLACANQASSGDKHNALRRAVWCRAEGTEANRQLSAGTPFEVAEAVEEEGDSKVVRLPLNALAEEAGIRRTKLVSFTCNKCGGRSSRAVNPLAWEKGLVFGQCSHCSVWHVLSAKNPKIYEEIRYNDVDQVNSTTK